MYNDRQQSVSVLQCAIRRVAEVFGRVFVLTEIFIKGGY